MRLRLCSAAAAAQIVARRMPCTVGPVGRGQMQYAAMWKAAQRMTSKPVKFGTVTPELVAFAAPDALDLSKETDETKKLYGLDNPKSTHFAKQCLMARRLVERGVPFVEW